MSGPWEKYGEQPAKAPWERYGGQAEDVVPATTSQQTKDLESVPQWGRDNPTLYGLYGAGRAVARAGLEGIGTAGGAALGALVPVPGASLAGAGLGYAGSKRLADLAMGEPVDTTLAGIGKDVALGAAFQGAGNIVGKGVLKALPQGAIDKMYASSLKLSTSPRVLPIAERNKIIETGLREKAVPNIKGYEKIVGKIDDLNDQVESIISSAGTQGENISSRAVASRLDELLLKGDEVAKVDPGFKKAIVNVKKELLKGPDEIPIEQAQQLKRHIYKTYKDFYGISDKQLAYVSGKKQVARGLKEEIETLHPEVKDLNMKEGELLNFLDPYGRAVARIQNRDLVGLGMQTAPLAGAVLSGGSSIAARAAAVAKLIDTPSLKARLAILLNQSKKAGTGTLRQAAGRATPLAGIASIESTEQEQP